MLSFVEIRYRFTHDIIRVNIISENTHVNCIFCFADANGPTIVTTIVPLGPQSTHTICPHCHAEIDTTTKTEPGMIAYISGVIIALLG